ncbi:MAG TPA: 6-carboxytetrahydropterin synthase QueD [Methanotrichaceae archaeon]|nr:6-carboxytetrahydropterin synthase QueD [Methanotrichaceae archaeon]
MKIGLVSEFDAAHHLPGYKGKCANIHGHTYKVEAVLDGPVDDASGFVMDFFDFKKVLGQALEDLDHRYLNEILPSPTAEHIAVYISSRLKKELLGTPARLVSVKLWEGKNKWVMVDEQ